MSSPIIMAAGGAVILVVVFLLSGNTRSKRWNERFGRVSRKQKFSANTTVLSLRKHVDNPDNAMLQALANMRSISRLQTRLTAAGATTPPHKFLLTMMGVVLAVFFVVTVMLQKSPQGAILVALGLGVGLPHLMLGRKIKKRQMLFLKLFPEAIELMVRGLRAGLPIGESFQVVSRELPPPMGDNFATITQQIALGVPMEKSLTEVAGKLNVTEFNFFVTTVILQRETGGNLGEILSNLAEMLRQRQMMKLKIGALSSEARASAYIVGALPFVVFLMLEVVSPEYLRPLFNDVRGNHALMGAGFSMGLGAFIMRQMTQLEI